MGASLSLSRLLSRAESSAVPAGPAPCSIVQKLPNPQPKLGAFLAPEPSANTDNTVGPAPCESRDSLLHTEDSATIPNIGICRSSTGNDNDHTSTPENRTAYQSSYTPPTIVPHPRITQLSCTFSKINIIRDLRVLTALIVASPDLEDLNLQFEDNIMASADTKITMALAFREVMDSWLPCPPKFKGGWCSWMPTKHTPGFLVTLPAQNGIPRIKSFQRSFGHHLRSGSCPLWNILAEDWTALLPHLTFSHLTQPIIHESGIGPEVLSEFVLRHPTISWVDLDVEESQGSLFLPPITLPALHTIELGEGPSHQLFAGLHLTSVQNNLQVFLPFRRDTKRARASLDAALQQISALPVTTLFFKPWTAGKWVQPRLSRGERATAHMLKCITAVRLCLSEPNLGPARNILGWLAELPSLTTVSLSDLRDDRGVPEKGSTWGPFVEQVKAASASSGHRYLE
ncbi:hypothetical protein B0H16DRAFT_1769341 [Mycena metata]|uniref:Uncharacterized protein n=1 Tax=Mycena metata TaxID=1033252 RepID=A0AAD7JXB8_9AGAR|nr:hypothetical protein B0H16DRAFT_1769341 [Mycena metata]